MDHGYNFYEMQRDMFIWDNLSPPNRYMYSHLSLNINCFVSTMQWMHGYEIQFSSIVRFTKSINLRQIDIHKSTVKNITTRKWHRSAQIYYPIIASNVPMFLFFCNFRWTRKVWSCRCSLSENLLPALYLNYIEFDWHFDYIALCPRESIQYNLFLCWTKLYSGSRCQQNCLRYVPLLPAVVEVLPVEQGPLIPCHYNLINNVQSIILKKTPISGYWSPGL